MEKNEKTNLIQLLTEDSGWQKMSGRQLVIAIWFTLSFILLPVVVPQAIDDFNIIALTLVIINLIFACCAVRKSNINVKE